MDPNRTVSVGGVELLTAKTGSGPRLLVLPGSVADLRKANSAQNTRLTETFEVLTFDPRGLGRSAKPDVPYSMADYAADAVGVMQAYGWDQAHVVGISFGGMVGQELAIRFPELIDRLVLVSCASGGVGGSSYPIEEFVGLPPVERARRALAVSDLSFTDEWIAANPKAAEERIQRTIEGMARFADEPGCDVGRARQLAARAEHNTYDRLDSIVAPTLVLAGSRDGQAPVAYQQTLANSIQASSFRLLDGGHGVLFENCDALDIVTRFLLNKPTPKDSP